MMMMMMMIMMMRGAWVWTDDHFVNRCRHYYDVNTNDH